MENRYVLLLIIYKKIVKKNLTIFLDYENDVL